MSNFERRLIFILAINRKRSAGPHVTVNVMAGRLDWTRHNVSIGEDNDCWGARSGKDLCASAHLIPCRYFETPCRVSCCAVGQSHAMIWTRHSSSVAADSPFNACMHPLSLHLPLLSLCTEVANMTLALVQCATTAAHPEQPRIRWRAAGRASLRLADRKCVL